MFFFNKKEGFNDNQIIPKKIFQTWHTKDLLPKMRENVEYNKKIHSDFEYFFFDDEDCRIFIKHYFGHSVLAAFDNFIPGAYRADLWRYCVLYIHGGIYMDIKFRPVNGFTLHSLLYNEYFVRDLPNSGLNGVYNGVMVCKPKNPILLKCIDQIVESVKKLDYGTTFLELSGPHLLMKFFDEESIKKFELSLGGNGIPGIHEIRYKKNTILSGYPEYREEQKSNQTNEHYVTLWSNRNIYNYYFFPDFNSV